MHFGLLLFTTDTGFAREAEAAGIDGFIVDWEGVGKRVRQGDADTEVNQDTPEDLSRVREAVSSPVICRINGFGPDTGAEVDEAIARGADELLLPMVTAVEQVERVIEMARGRVQVGILVETEWAIESADDLAALPISRAYVGLNDLAIVRGSGSLFEAIADGTVESVRGQFEVPFGFGGLTLPERGEPVACRLLMGEMARLGSNFAFLRRSYRADVPPGEQGAAVAAIRNGLRRARERDAASVESDREELARSVEAAAAP